MIGDILNDIWIHEFKIVQELGLEEELDEITDRIRELNEKIEEKINEA